VIVGATHQDLRTLIKEGRFREDLYYRLAEIEVNIPPLRSRQGDAVLLANAYLRRFAQEQRRSNLSFSDDAIQAIERHAWPGNVRELINVIKRAAIMADGQRVSAADLGLPEVGRTIIGTIRAQDLDLRVARETAERRTIVLALARTSGNIAKTAEILGVSRPTLYDLMHRLAIK
jgi:two-component system NtrC family response regulator